jgi:hypothetical protein
VTPITQFSTKVIGNHGHSATLVIGELKHQNVSLTLTKAPIAAADPKIM